jgi:hypothetical protein
VQTSQQTRALHCFCWPNTPNVTPPLHFAAEVTGGRCFRMFGKKQERCRARVLLHQKYQPLQPFHCKEHKGGGALTQSKSRVNMTGATPQRFCSSSTFRISFGTSTTTRPPRGPPAGGCPPGGGSAAAPPLPPPADAPPWRVLRFTNARPLMRHPVLQRARVRLWASSTDSRGDCKAPGLLLATCTCGGRR